MKDVKIDKGLIEDQNYNNNVVAPSTNTVVSVSIGTSTTTNTNNTKIEFKNNPKDEGEDDVILLD